MVPRIDHIEAAACDSEHEAAWLERNLLEHSKPRWNRAIGGLEHEVYIGLNRRLELRHDAGGPGLVFGPYLGGDKVRLALSGLHRVIPLAYTGARLNGSDRDMARALGVAPDSRTALVDLVVAVLHRDPDAVARLQAGLAARRDAASTALAYELAARIHAEGEALTWLLGEQKVTRADWALDLDVHGWSDGILVTFQVKRGRVRAWQARPCDEAEGRRLVAGTPDEWRAFADRNATLAARLRAALG
jgi:excinuclease ABC subunit C